MGGLELAFLMALTITMSGRANLCQSTPGTSCPERSTSISFFFAWMRFWRTSTRPTSRGCQWQNDEPLILGWKHDGLQTDHFVGLISDVQIYNRDLSLSEIRDLYNHGRSTHQPNTAMEAVS